MCDTILDTDSAWKELNPEDEAEGARGAGVRGRGVRAQRARMEAERAAAERARAEKGRGADPGKGPQPASSGRRGPGGPSAPDDVSPPPWYWSAAVLAGIFGLSLCILTSRVKSLDRLK